MAVSRVNRNVSKVEVFIFTTGCSTSYEQSDNEHWIGPVLSVRFGFI